MQNKSNLSRREFLKIAGAGLGSLALTANACVSAGASSNEELPLEEHWALLYDATQCSGCRECERACKAYNKLPEENVDDLSGNTFTLIKLYQSEDGAQKSFRKYQCMHCVDPACAASCPVGALHKIENGPVVYDAYKCIGCRYCMQACAFGVPRYDWSLAYPFIRKCEMCYHREAGPACADICPKQALLFGRRGDLLEIAKMRISVNPGKYFEDRVYGEFEGGGTSVLILSGVPFEAIGLPGLDPQPLPDRTQWALNIVPAIFFGVGGAMSAVYQRTKNKTSTPEEEVKS
ncbi:MAG: 4Fe-4S dicluster domain-containing protein [Chloroflexi bacterium]|nr:4Fe-4S dicluster domain-containing protein [Chloroflexota bacterium]